MRITSPILAVVLSLAILMALPSVVTLPRVYGSSQSGNTRWSPFGPQEQSLIISVEGDFVTMFNAFTSGQLDITDWAIQPSNLGTGSSAAFCDSNFNPDFFCTTPTSELGIFDLQINSIPSVMGIPLTTPRTIGLASVTVGASTSACSVGFGSLTVTLENQETGNSVIKDQYNSLTAANKPSGSPSSTVSDSGGSTPNGIYKLPCLLAGSYGLSTSVYGGNVNTTITSAVNTAVTLHVNWNSLSNTFPTNARFLWGAALAHMLDGPEFVSGLFGLAACHDNTFDPGDNAPGCTPSPIITPPTAAAEWTTADCQFGNHIWTGSPCVSGSDVSAYNFVDDKISGSSLWWQLTGSLAPGPGYSGHNDLRAACDDLVSMGLSLSSQAGSGGCENVANALSNSTLTGTPWTASSYPHVVPNGQINFLIRTSLGRKLFGTIIADTLNAIFGTPSVTGGGTVNYGSSLSHSQTPSYSTISQVAPCVFSDGPVSAGGNGPNCWQLYTGGFTLGSTPDATYALFNSQFSGGNCYTPGPNTPPASAQPNDYVNFCDPQVDTDTSAGEFSTSSGPLFRRATVEGLNAAMDVPVYSGVDSFVELNGWNFQQCGSGSFTGCANTQSSIVNTKGSGTQLPYWTLLNARQVPGYVPTNPLYAPGGRTGTSDNGLVRMGFSQTLLHLSVFQYTTVWEADIVSQVYDSMLTLNPLTYFADSQFLDWQTTSHTSSFSPTATCSSPGTGPVVGCTTQIWHLRNDLKFQDGNPVTASDVAYSILAERDVPSANLGPTVANVVSAQGLDCGMGQPCKTLKVVLALNSPFYEVDVGGALIIEQALWQPYCGSVAGAGGLAGNFIPNASTSQCANLSFDPMTATDQLNGIPGIFIGDGPFSCVVPTGFPNAGHVGGSCTETASNTLGTQAVDTGGRILLQRNNLYDRCCPGGTGAAGSSLYKESYADANNDGIVNIQDLAGAAACFGTASGATAPLCTAAQSSYWVNPNIAPGSSVNISDLATVAFYFGAGTTNYGGASILSSMTGVDPQIDPFNCASTGC